jgi:hydrogenase maturation protease
VDKLLSQPDGVAGAQGAGVRLRVVGCGNPFASDDSAGLEVVRRLRASGESECDFVELPQAGVELMEVLEDAETVMFIDAVSSGAPAGTLHLVPLPSEDVEPRALGVISSHGWGLAETLRLMAVLDRPTPRLLLVGIEIENALPGGVPSPAVKEAIRIVVERFPALCAIVQAEENILNTSPRCFAPGDASFPGCGDDPA